MKKALAFDIGGTKIFSTIINEAGEIAGEIEKFSTPDNINDISALLNKQIKKYESDVDVVAIATAGAVNNENTAVIGSTGNLAEGYSSIDFQSLSNKRVFVENDVPIITASDAHEPEYVGNYIREATERIEACRNEYQNI